MLIAKQCCYYVYIIGIWFPSGLPGRGNRVLLQGPTQTFKLQVSGVSLIFLSMCMLVTMEFVMVCKSLYIPVCGEILEGKNISKSKWICQTFTAKILPNYIAPILGLKANA